MSVSALPGGWFSFFRVKVASLSKKMAAWLYSAASSLIVFSLFASIAVLSVVLVAVFVFSSVVVGSVCSGVYSIVINCNYPIIC